MKREVILLCLFICTYNSFGNKKLWAPPTIATSNVTFAFIEGNTFRINWTSGNGARRIVVMRQGSPVTALPANGVDYNPSTTFGNGDAIQPGQFVVHDNPGSLVDVLGLQPGTTYHVAIYEYNGTGATTEYLTTSPAASQTTLTAPITPATNVVFSNVTGNSMTITWTNGNGNRRLVIMRAGSAVNVNPVDLTAYSGAANFGSGTHLGNGNYAVYSFTGNSVNVSTLQPSTTYHVSVFEYNGSTGPVYLVTSPAIGSRLTLPRPTVASSNTTFNFVEGNSMRLNWTSGNGTRRIVVARAGSAVDAVPVDGTDYVQNTNFTLAAEISPGQRVLYDNVTTSVDINGLTPATTYHFRIYEYDGTGASIAYLTSSFASSSMSTLSAPVTPASNVVFTNVSSSSLTVGWTNGSGGRRIVLMKAGSVVDANPVDGMTYGPSGVFGSGGSQIGSGNYVLFSSTGNSVNVTGLTPGITYHVAVFEYNGISGPVYLTTNPATGSQLTSLRPTIAATNLNFNFIEGGDMRLNWTSGNGSRRIVIGRVGTAVDAVPIDGTDYVSNTNFTLAPEISPGQRVLYDNTGSFADISGLTPATTYHFRVYEYSGTGSNIAYLTSSFASGSQATLSPPTTPATNVVFSNVGSNSMTVGWTNGNGARRIVLMKAGSAVDGNPVDAATYVTSGSFGSGSQIGSGNYVLYSSTGNSVNVTNLTPGIVYHVAVFEYNGSTSPTYLTTNPGRGNQITSLRPTVATSNLLFNFLEGNSMRLNWTNGNGSRRIVVARAGSAVDAVPIDGTDYVENSNFTLASEISPGQRILYDNASTFVDISGLSAGITYHFRIYEYSGTGASIQYLTTAFLSGNQATLSTPGLQASNMSFSSVTGNSLTVGWTNGDGSRRLIIARQGTAVNADPIDFTTYSANGSFGAGAQIGSGNFVVANTTTSTANITNLTAGTTYHFAVYEFNGGTGPVYLRPGLAGSTTTLGAPQAQATNATTGNVTGGSFQINWNNGSGNRRLVLMKQGSAVNANPVDNTTYTANSFFGSGSQLGSGNYAVFNGTAATVTVTGLQGNTTYHFAVFEYNSFGANSQYLILNPARGSATTQSSVPVMWLGFTAKTDKNKVVLEWSTAQELNSSHYDVERSSDGANYIMIGKITAAGNTSNRSDYKWADELPAAGVNYYRLKQVDADGKFNYSKVLRINYSATSLIKRYTNPVSNSIYVELTHIVSQEGQWRLIDLNGKIVKQAGFNGALIKFSISTLPEGIYVLELRVNQKNERIRIMKTAN